MSLRQRGQRASESSNEGGRSGSFYDQQGQQHQEAAPSSGGYGRSFSDSTSSTAPGNRNRNMMHNTTNQPPPPPPPGGMDLRQGSFNSSASSGYNNSTMASPTIPNRRPSATPGPPSSAGSHGGFYSMASPIPSPASGGGLYGNHNYPQTAPPVVQQSSRGGGNHNAGSYGSYSAGQVGISGRALHFDAPGSGGVAAYGAAANVGGYGGASTNNYATGGYTADQNSYRAATATAPASSATNNPYQKSTKSKSASFGNVLLAFALISFITLLGTTIYYKRDYDHVQVQLNASKEYAASLAKQRNGGRTGGRYNNKNNNKKKGGKYSGRSGGSKSMADELQELRRSNDKMDAENKQLQSKSNDLQSQLKAEDAAIGQLEIDLSALKHTLEVSHHDVAHSKEEMEKYNAMMRGKIELEKVVVKREGALWERIELLHSKIQRLSRREAEEWFGPGPHKVEITLEYPQIQKRDWPQVSKTIVVLLASLDQMPHTVNFFLTQVHHKLWDGIPLQSNADHIFHFEAPGPTKAEDGTESDSKQMRKFRDSELDKLSFQEYNADHPHKQYTIGFAGRPGGTALYINKKDNTLIHGPGGQPNNNMHPEADPCFGTIVEGLDVIREIELVPADATVTITSIRTLFKENNPVDERFQTYLNEQHEKRVVVPGQEDQKQQGQEETAAFSQAKLGV